MIRPARTSRTARCVRGGAGSLVGAVLLTLAGVCAGTGTSTAHAEAHHTWPAAFADGNVPDRLLTDVGTAVRGVTEAVAPDGDFHDWG
ncbi:hypothetical protein [Streptomyces sp. NPDC093591]|uniref:hypothetical protein n=1 Tax=Streptomyces sp. NPDC093591 TaxID=3366044 RepID=UPI0038175D7A